MPTRPRRLLLVISDLGTLGGAEVQLGHLAGGLAAAGHRVTLVSIRGRAGDATPPLDGRVRLVALGASGRQGQLAGLRRLVRLAHGHDLVHCTGWDASLWGRLAAVLARRPVVVAEHTAGREHQVAPSGAPRGPVIARHNRLLDRFTAATVICAEWQRELLHGEGVAPAKIELIPNGVPVAELRRRAGQGLTRAALGIPAEATVITHVARFRPQKRQTLTLETTARLRETLGDVRVVFAGTGTDLEAVKAQATAMGADWATFLGRTDEVPSVFGLGDLTVLPSTGEAMPMSILEAVAVGTPVVAADVGDVGPLLRRTGAGLTFPADRPEAFATVCAGVLADAQVRDRLATAALAARAEIDAATMVRRYVRLLEPLSSPEDGEAALRPARGSR